MVTPDNTPRITSNTSSSRDVSSSQDTKRKPPTGNFDKVADDVDQKKPKGENEAEGFSLEGKDKKKPIVKSPGLKTDEDAPPLVSPFELARGHRDSSDEGRGESEGEGFEEMTVAEPESLTKAKKKFNPFDQRPEGYQPHPIVTEQTHSSFKEERETPTYGLGSGSHLAGITPQPRQEPLISEVGALSETESKPTPPPLPVALQDLVDQIVKEIVSLKDAGQTETVLSLKGNFEGSRVIITESTTAPGQVSITIDNLSAENQALLEMSRTRLINDLMQSGVHVQRFTASAIVETTNIDVATQDKGSDDQQRGGQQRQGQQQQQQQQSEEET